MTEESNMPGLELTGENYLRLRIAVAVGNMMAALTEYGYGRRLAKTWEDEINLFVEDIVAAFAPGGCCEQTRP